MTDAVKTLTREIRRAKGVQEGTIVRFERDMEQSGQSVLRNVPNFPKSITYAAIFVGGRWYFTGRGGLGTSAMTNREFLDRMAEPDISNVRVATDFERVA
jgi:hypothetical protein